MAKFWDDNELVSAVRVKVRVKLTTLDGTLMMGYPGDWLITRDSGDRFVRMDGFFRDLCKPADDEAREMMGEE